MSGICKNWESIGPGEQSGGTKVGGRISKAGSKQNQREHGNKYRGSPKAIEGRCMSHAQVAQVSRKRFRRSPAKFRKQGQDNIRVCILDRQPKTPGTNASSTEESKHSTGASTEVYSGVRGRTQVVARADAGASALIYIIVCGFWLHFAIPLDEVSS